MMVDPPLKSVYGKCVDIGHKTFDDGDTYIIVTVITSEPIVTDRTVVQFQACNDNCASNHLFKWLAKGYYISFQWSTPEIRESIQDEIDKDRELEEYV